MPQDMSYPQVIHRCFECGTDGYCRMVISFIRRGKILFSYHGEYVCKTCRNMFRRIGDGIEVMCGDKYVIESRGLGKVTIVR